MMPGQWPLSYRIFKRLAKALIRLHEYAGWSEPLLVAHTILLEIPCCGSSNHLTAFTLYICIIQDQPAPEGAQ